MYINVERSSLSYAGWIYDAFEDYSYAFYVAGMMNIVGVLIMFLITYFKQEGNLRQKVLFTLSLGLITVQSLHKGQYFASLPTIFCKIFGTLGKSLKF